MTEPLVLHEGQTRRGRRAARARRGRRLRWLVIWTLATAASLAGVLAFMAPRASGPAGIASRSIRASAHRSRASPRPAYGSRPAPASQRVRVRFKLGLRSGLLFNVRTGRVMWERRSAMVVPIASLTKMMTALVVVAHARPGDTVGITRDAIHYSGSGVGLLPLGKRVSLESLLYGLLLPSGNDAAIALAEHVARTQNRFISMMNVKARQMHLVCTHFTTVSGFIDAGNHSCASDLAIITHAMLEQRLLAHIVASSRAILPFPIKGGKLYLYNNNPLLRLRYPGTDGVKTGFTDAAGRCLVAAARRGRRWFGVVLLHSGDPADQAQQLLNAAFARVRV